MLFLFGSICNVYRIVYLYNRLRFVVIYIGFLEIHPPPITLKKKNKRQLCVLEKRCQVAPVVLCDHRNFVENMIIRNRLHSIQIVYNFVFGRIREGIMQYLICTRPCLSLSPIELN